MEARTAAVKTLTAEWTYTVAFPDHVKQDSGTVELMKPNYAAIVYDLHTPFYRRVNSDGTTLWTFYPPMDAYEKTDGDPQGQNIRVGDSLVIQAFFNAFAAVKQSVYTGNDLSDLHYAGTERVDDVTYQVLEHRTVGTIAGRRAKSVRAAHLHRPGRPDSPLRAEIPAGRQARQRGRRTAKRPGRRAPDGGGLRLRAPGVRDALDAQAPPAAPPAAGTPAPDFTAQDRAGGGLALSDYRDRVVVLDFWASWWAPPSDPTAHVAHWPLWRRSTRIRTSSW